MTEFKQVICDLLNLCDEKNIKIVTAESCTGGMIAHEITDFAGASSVFERGFITYSNEAKIQSLGVNKDVIDKYGAVSRQVAIEMAKGALSNSCANLSISVTGIAGPTGATSKKPLGLVYIASQLNDNKSVCKKHIFGGDRDNVRKAAMIKAFELMLHQLKAL